MNNFAEELDFSWGEPSLEAPEELSRSWGKNFGHFRMFFLLRSQNDWMAQIVCCI